MLCVTKLIHHCCQRTLSLQNAVRNFQQCSLERKHGIVLKYSPEDNQKSKLGGGGGGNQNQLNPLTKPNHQKTTFPLKCVLLLLQMFMKSVVHLSPEGFFILFLCMSCSYILERCFCCCTCSGNQLVISLLCGEAGSYFYFFLNSSYSHLQKKKNFVSEILFQI